MSTALLSPEVPLTELPPLRTLPRPGLGASCIGQEEEDLLLQVVRSKRFFRYTYELPPAEQGAMVATLEREFREMMGAKFALGVTSGTAALETALAALGIGPGDEVIVPAWSWTSCYTSIVRVGARPVLAEIDDTFCLAASEIPRLVTPRTKAAMVIHYQGVPADMDPILAEAKKAGIAVIEDCAEATGAIYKGRRIGSMGDVGIFSFQNQKMMTSGEGGMVITSDSRLYERAVRFHDLGMVRDHHRLFVTPTETEFCGAQYRMNEMTGAVALAQLRKLEASRAKCRAVRAEIHKRIGHLKGLSFRKIVDPSGDNAFETYFCLSNDSIVKEFTEALRERGVNCAKMTGTYCHYYKDYCVHRMAHAPLASPFAHETEWPAKGYRKEDFPITESLVHRFVVLPTGVLHTPDDGAYIGDTVAALYERIVLPTL